MNLTACLRTTLLAAVLVAPVAAQADDALYLKGGFTRLTDNTQVFNSLPRTFDADGTGNFGILFEHRTRRDISLGVELLNYRNDFSPAGEFVPAAGAGVASTRSVQFVVKKYLGHNVFRPFFGLGIGLAHTEVDYNDTGWTDDDVGLALQAMFGLELRFQGMGLMFEVKRMAYDMDSSLSDYNPSAIGLFVGIGFNW